MEFQLTGKKTACWHFSRNALLSVQSKGNSLLIIRTLTNESYNFTTEKNESLEGIKRECSCVKCQKVFQNLCVHLIELKP